MKNTIRTMLAIVLAVAAVVTIMPAGEAKAIEPITDKRAFQTTLDEVKLFCGFILEDETVDSFVPTKYTTYEQVFRWLYNGREYFSTNTHERAEKRPSAKKVVAWGKQIWYNVARTYPEYAQELTEAFLDGRGEKWSYKKKASRNFVRWAVYVFAYDKNGGDFFGGREGCEFDCDPTRVDQWACEWEYQNGDANALSTKIRTMWKNFGSSSDKYLYNIEALEYLFQTSTLVNSTPLFKR